MVIRWYTSRIHNLRSDYPTVELSIFAHQKRCLAQRYFRRRRKSMDLGLSTLPVRWSTFYVRRPLPRSGKLQSWTLTRLGCHLLAIDRRTDSNMRTYMYVLRAPRPRSDSYDNSPPCRLETKIAFARCSLALLDMGSSARDVQTNLPHAFATDR